VKEEEIDQDQYHGFQKQFLPKKRNTLGKKIAYGDMDKVLSAVALA
jgi:hypothetical protein